MQEDEPKDDFAEYRREIERIEIDQGQWVDVNRQAAFDYGQFTIKKRFVGVRWRLSGNPRIALN